MISVMEDPTRPHPILEEVLGPHRDSMPTDLPTLPIKKAIILCTDERTGSQWLCQRMAATRRLGRPTEYFNWYWMSKYYSWYPQDPEAQLDLARRLGTTSNGVFSIKLHPWHLDLIGDSLDLYSNLGECYFVRLVRRNALLQAISLARAIQTGIYHHDDTKTKDESFDPEQIDQILRTQCLNGARWALFFARNGIEPLELVYEDLRRDPSRAIRRIGQFAGVKLPLFSRRIPREHRVVSDATNEDWRRTFLEVYRDLNTFPTYRLAE